MCKSLIFKNILTENVYPIGGYIAPFKVTVDDCSTDLLTVEIVQMLKQCGINFAIDTHGWEDPIDKRLIELFSEQGIGLFISDSRVMGLIGEDVSNSDKEVLEKCIAEYKKENCFLGPYFCDEPRAHKFSRLGALTSLYKELNIQGTTPYINLLPYNDGYKDDICYTDYGGYLSRFISEVGLPYISYDAYPLGTGLENQTVKGGGGYFYTLNKVSEEALKSGIPFWHFVQCGGQWEAITPAKEQYPNEAQFLWDINTGIAFGAKGIEYFPLFQPYCFYSTAKDRTANGLIDFFGKPNIWYKYAAESNKFLQDNAAVLLNSELMCVMFLGGSEMLPPHGGVVINDIKYDYINYAESNHCILGLFKLENKKLIYIVNNSFSENGYVGIRFNKPYRCCVKEQKAMRFTKNEDTVLFHDVQAGSAVILIIE